VFETRSAQRPSQFHRNDRKERKEHRNGHRIFNPSQHLIPGSMKAREVPDNDDRRTEVVTWHAPSSAAMAILSGFFAMGFAIVAFFAFQICG